MKKATIVIPNYNGIKYIEMCLGSLFAQMDREECQVLVVDNGSKDGSLQLIEDKFPEAKLIALPENTGFCHAVNVGIEKADTPYVILLNNDTKVLPGFTDGLVKAIEKDLKLFAVSALMLQWDDPTLVDDAGDRYCALGWAWSRGKGKKAESYKLPSHIFAACGGAAIYRREIFSRIGLFDEQHFAYLEDIDICYRAAIYGYRCSYEPSAAVIHAGSASSGSRYNPFKTTLSSANSIYLIGKNMPLLQIIWNLPFIIPGFLIKALFFFHKKMGILYLKGLWQGIKKLHTPQGKAARVRFSPSNLRNYFWIQGQLYLNIFRIPGKR